MIRLNFKNFNKQHLYTLAAAISIAVLVINQVFIQYWLFKKNDDARVINLSGRQRMLSQKINLYFYQYAEGNRSKAEVQEVFNEWENVHHAFLEENEDIGFSPIENKEVRSLLENLNDKIAFIGSILSQNQATIEHQLSAINQNQTAFLSEMDRAVKLLALDADRKLRFLVIMEIVLMLISVSIVLFKTRYIFKPYDKENKRQIAQLADLTGKMNLVMESMSEIIIFLNPNGEILLKNKKSELFLERLLKGAEIKDILSEDSVSWFKIGFETSLNGKKWSAEEQLIYKEKHHWYRVFFYPIYNSINDNLEGVTLFASNIDMQRKQKSQLEEQAQTISIHQETFKQIAWDQAHGVRRPLANAKIFIDLLQNDQSASQDEKEEYRKLLGKSLDELDDVIAKIINSTSS